MSAHRQTIRQRERLDRFARQFPRPDYREGPLNSMLIGACAGVLALAFLILRCGGPA